jgi:cell division protein FtsI (penicillin-binding protein 3)
VTAAAANQALRWVRVRLCIIGGLLGVVLVVIGWRAFRLQVREAPRLRAMAEEQYLKEIEIGVHRGTILDRHGAVLAQSVEVDSIYANPRQIVDRREVAQQLARALALRPEDVLAKLQQRRYFSWIKRRVSRDEARAVQALRLPGLGATTEPRRFYPNQDLAGPLLGHAGVDGRGLDGIELALDPHLRGERRTVAGLRDALGRELFVSGTPDARTPAANDVVLTIDKFIQYAAERALAEGVAKQRAKAGTVIVLDPKTGQVLALAASPGLDPNRPGAARDAGARNRAVTDPYEPGSTMKIFSVVSALDAGVVKPTDTWHCENGRMKIGKYTIHDAHPHGVLTTAEVIQKSSNIGATKIARRLGKERLHEYLLNFGFGRPTGTGLPGERAGRVRRPERWGEIGLATVSFGQGITATPMQMLTALAAVGNGGMLQPPTVVLKVRDAAGRTVYAPAPQPRRVLRPETARTMVEMLKLVTKKGGTATQAAIPGFEVGGKTGTAQKVDPATGHYSRDKVIATFMGLVPADDPKLAIIVIIDEPGADHYGGLVSGPVFKRLAEEVLRYLGATANEALQAAPAEARGATEEAFGAGELVPEPEAPPAPDPAPAARAAAAEDGADLPAADDTDEANDLALAGAAESQPRPPAPVRYQAQPGEDDLTQVPDFGGMSVGQALRVAREAGLRIDVRGSGRGRAQSVLPGAAPRGTRIQVTFAPP